MKIPIFQVDAFADSAFEGNPAAVCILEKMLPDDILQKIASEFNLSETAFIVKISSGGYHLRWFTPLKEVSLCGHATLASAHILFTEAKIPEKVSFQTLSGVLEVINTNDDHYEMTLPMDYPKPLDITDGFDKIGVEFLEVFEGKDDYLLILKDQALSLIHI